MQIKPDHIDLGHRAFFLRGLAQGPYYLAADKEGHVTIFDSDLRIAQTFFTDKTNSIALHPSGEILATAGGKSGSVTLRQIDGAGFHEIAAPEVEDRWVTWKGFRSCLFDDTQKLLWLVGNQSPTECEIHVIEVGTWKTVASTRIHDPYGGSAYHFYLTPQKDVICLWMAAGQDGQQLFWLSLSDKGIEFTPGLENTSPPTFSPDGKSFLVVDDIYRLCQYEFSTMEQIGPSVQTDDEDDAFNCSHCFLTSERAIAGTNSGRIFAVDTTKMVVTGEVFVEGHEPRPTREYFPRLVNDETLCTDIAWFDRSGNRVMFVFRRSAGTEINDWKDTVLVWQV